MTIAELREETRRYADTDEVFVNGLPVLQLSLQAGAIDGRPVAAIEIVTEPE